MEMRISDKLLAIRKLWRTSDLTIVLSVIRMMRYVLYTQCHVKREVLYD